MWARVHKVDKIRPQANGGAVVLIDDERTPSQIQRAAAVSTLIAVARVLDARQVLDARYAGKGEVRYLGVAGAPSFLMDAVARAGAHYVDREHDRVEMPAQAASVEALVDVAFSDLAHHTKAHLGVSDLRAALAQLEKKYRASPLDRDLHPARYWPAVFELAALAGELSRPRKARWIEVREMPVPFAVKFPESAALAHPHLVAQEIVAGREVFEPLEPGGPSD